jgi:hypothetical protein
MILGFTSRPNKKRAGNTARLLLLGLTFFWDLNTLIDFLIGANFLFEHLP